MGIANVWGLIGLIGIPIIIILYMLRPKNKPMTIPSLYLWKQMVDEIESASRLKKLKSSILMFIQMLVVFLLSLILAGLFVRSTEKASKKSTPQPLVLACGQGSPGGAQGSACRSRTEHSQRSTTVSPQSHFD